MRIRDIIDFHDKYIRFSDEEIKLLNGMLLYYLYASGYKTNDAEMSKKLLKEIEKEIKMRNL